MAEQDMIAAVQAALDHHGIEDTIEQVGQFKPRGMSGAGMAGAVGGAELGGVFGSFGEIAGFAVGSTSAEAGVAKAHNLPLGMLVGASPSTIYGWKMLNFGRRREPNDLVFQIARDRVDVVVHGRVTVRTLELIDRESGARIELEGPRLPVTHAHDLIRYIAGDEATNHADEQASEAGETDDPEA